MGETLPIGASPIKTAPKDGAIILARGIHGGDHQAFWERRTGRWVAINFSRFAVRQLYPVELIGWFPRALTSPQEKTDV